MADIMHLEDGAQRSGARTVSAPMKAAKRKQEDGTKPEVNFEVHIPATLQDAVKIEGEKEVFKRYLQSLAIAIQQQKRVELGDAGEPKTRKRAAYFESVGL